MHPLFTDRQDAGRMLADALFDYAGRDDLIVLALPTGGVPVAFEVAEALSVPLDLMLVRKLRAPGQEELAMGAVAFGGARVLNAAVIDGLSIPIEAVEQAAQAELLEIERRNQLWRGGRPAPEVGGRCAILVDDGLATGSTMRAAVASLRRLGPARIVAAVPLAPPDTILRLQAETDEAVFLEAPEPFLAVGRWYRDFPQVTDEEVKTLLERAGGGAPA